MNKSLESYNLPRLKHEDIENLNWLITSKEIETLIENLPQNKSPLADSFTGEFYQTFRDLVAILLKLWGFQEALVVKNLPANAGDLSDAGLIHGLGRSPGGGHGNPLQYSCLENPMDRGAWQATIHKAAKSWT